MVRPPKKSGLLLSLLFLLTAPSLAGPPDWQGTWEGEMGTGSHLFRVAFVLKEGTGEYDNIDDGIYGEAMTLEGDGRKLQGRTDGGGVLELSKTPGQAILTGIFTQGPGADIQRSLVLENQGYPVTLHRGEDYLRARLGSDGGGQTPYQYALPAVLSDGWEIGDLRKSRADLPKVEGVVRDILTGSFPHIHSLAVVKDGKLVLDEYFYGYGPNDLHPVQSVTKDIFSLLFGIGVGQGLVQPEQKLFDSFPEYRLKPNWEKTKDSITLESLLTMTSGLGCDDFKDSESCSWKMVASPDWLDFSLSLPQQNPPGSHFAYCGACLTPLGVILERQSGLSLPEYAQKFLFGPLGIQETRWWDGPGDSHSPAFGLALRPRDMAKLGYLMVKKGEWKGREVVPESWITRSTSPFVPNTQTGKEADYGYLWWERDVTWHGKKHRSLDAWGVGGQHVFIVPDLDLVCVLTGGNYKDGNLANNSFKIFHEVLEAFR